MRSACVSGFRAQLAYRLNNKSSWPRAVRDDDETYYNTGVYRPFAVRGDWWYTMKRLRCIKGRGSGRNSSECPTDLQIMPTSRSLELSLARAHTHTHARARTY